MTEPSSDQPAVSFPERAGVTVDGKASQALVDGQIAKDTRSFAALWSLEATGLTPICAAIKGREHPPHREVTRSQLETWTLRSKPTTPPATKQEGKDNASTATRPAVSGAVAVGGSRPAACGAATAAGVSGAHGTTAGLGDGTADDGGAAPPALVVLRIFYSQMEAMEIMRSVRPGNSGLDILQLYTPADDKGSLRLFGYVSQMPHLGPDAFLVNVPAKCEVVCRLTEETARDFAFTVRKLLSEALETAYVSDDPTPFSVLLA